MDDRSVADWLLQLLSLLLLGIPGDMLPSLFFLARVSFPISAQIADCSLSLFPDTSTSREDTSARGLTVAGFHAVFTALPSLLFLYDDRRGCDEDNADWTTRKRDTKKG